MRSGIVVRLDKNCCSVLVKILTPVHELSTLKEKLLGLVRLWLDVTNWLDLFHLAIPRDSRMT